MRSIFMATTVIAAALAVWLGGSAPGALFPDAQFMATSASAVLADAVPEVPSALARIGSAALFILCVIWRKSRIPL